MEIAELDRKTAEDMVVEQLTEFFNKSNQNDLDMPVMELVIRNAFGMGATWKEEVIDKQNSHKKTYENGLSDMREIALSSFLDCEGYDEFERELNR